MGLLEFGLLLYFVTVVMAVTMTRMEQRQTATPWVFQVAGYAACTVWPLVAMVFMILRATARA